MARKRSLLLAPFQQLPDYNGERPAHIPARPLAGAVRLATLVQCRLQRLDLAVQEPRLRTRKTHRERESLCK